MYFRIEINDKHITFTTMKRNIFLTMMMLIASVATLSAQGELERTMAPQMWDHYIVNPEQCVLIEFNCGEEAVIHVLVDGEEVMQGESSCEYKIPCLYVEQEFVVSAYAQAEGKLPSDTISEHVFVPCLKIKAPDLLMHNCDGWEYFDYSEAIGGYYVRPYATIENPNSDELDVTVFYRIGVYGEQFEPEWGEWTEYGGYDEHGNLQHITYETDDPTISLILEAYCASVNHELESDHVCMEFSAVQLIEKPYWAEFDFTRDHIFYKITSDSTVSVCTKTLDQYDYPMMYNGAYSGDIIIPETVLDGMGHTYTVTGIDQVAFTNSQQLASVSMPGTIKFIGRSAFSADTLLSSITIPSSVDSIASYAFMYCTGLTNLAIPSSVKTIGNHAFAGCKSVTSVTVDSENTTFDSRDNCNAIIETVSNTLIAGFNNTVIPSSVTAIGNGAFALSSLTSIDIPNSITSIGNYAFEFSGLTSIDIPSSVTSIGDYAFSSSGLTTIVIPESVTKIGRAAIEYTEIRSMTCFAVTPPDIVCVFNEYERHRYDELALYVPMESLEAYRAHEEWGKIKHIVPILDACPGDINGDGRLTINDVTDLISLLLNDGELPDYCDVNGDGKVTITDVTTLIDMLLNGN